MTGFFMKHRRITAILMTVAMVLTLSGLSELTVMTASAASKKMKLSASKVTVKVGSSKKVKLKNAPKKAKTKWSVKNKKIASVKKGKITGKKKGNTKVTAKVTYKQSGKKKTKKFTVKVKVKAASVKKTTAPAVTTAPTVTKAPTKTTAPAVSTPTAVPTPTGLPAKVVIGPTEAPLDTETSNLSEGDHISANGQITRDNGIMRKNWTSKEFMREMGLGWNYGNSLEAGLDTKTDKEDSTVADYETAWNAGQITQENMDGIKKYGFGNIRIPVAWSNMIPYKTKQILWKISEKKTLADADVTEEELAYIQTEEAYTINDAYFNRVEEVMNYALNNELYVVINIHWDGDWWGQFGDAEEVIRNAAWTRFRSFWKQISARYKDYSDRLIFESANEELGDRLNDNWRKMSTTKKTGTLTEDEQYETANQINQEFVNLVRASGDNNAYRYLLISGFNTDIQKTCDRKVEDEPVESAVSRFVMPTDSEGLGNTKLSISVHYYTPWNYCGGSEYTGADKMTDWGSDADKKLMHDLVDMMKDFTKQGYGVIFGEFGVQTAGYDGVPTFIKEFSNYSIESGMVPVLWDNGAWFSRTTSQIKFDDFGDAIQEVTGSKVEFPRTSANTGIYEFKEADESELELVYEWTGLWSKNPNAWKQDADGNYYLEDPAWSKDADGTYEWAKGHDTWSVKGDDGSVVTRMIPYFETTSCSDGFDVYCNNGYYYWTNIFADWASLKDPYIRITSPNPEGSLHLGTATWKSGQKGEKETMEQTAMHVMDTPEGWNGKCISLDKTMLLSADALYMTFGNGPACTKIEIFDKKAE